MEQRKDSSQPFPAPERALPQQSTHSPDGAESAVSAVWQAGDVILDQYEVRGILGEGGMGKVYHVYHRGWNIDLAVKSPKPAIFARAGGKENFIREAETWVKLGLHSSIVNCFYVRTLGNIPRVFAEYVAGGSFADWIRTRRLYAGGHKLALERMLDIAIQFAWGLHYAHDQGLVHQDIKPANVMLTPEGIAKVTDFGLARARALAGESEGEIGDGQQSILVSSRGRTPAYCSPEQAAGQDLSRKTDIWSWGVSILEMFVGEVTWMAGEIAREVLASHQAQDPLIPSMPTDLVKLLGCCFQPRPEDRPTSMLEIATDLQAIYARLIGQPYPRQTPRPAELLADSLNNQALSLYDLGEIEQAKQKWKQALETDPQHLEATYNQGVVLWRRGEMTDDVLVQQLQSILITQSQSWLVRYLLAQVQVERGEVDVARTLLEEGMNLASEETEAQTLLEQVRSGSLPVSRCLSTFQGHTGSVESVSLSADSKYAFSASRDKTLRLWEVSTGRCLHIFQQHTTSGVELVSLSADGRYALSVAWSTLSFWEVSTGRCLSTFQVQATGVISVDLSADGRYALTGISDGTVRLWEVSTGRCLRIFQGHTHQVFSVKLSADNHYALSASADRTVRLWEVSTSRCLRVFEGHTDIVQAVSLSGGGLYALSASADRTVRLWEVSTGRCLRVLQGHTDRVNSVSLSADSLYALSGSADRTLRLWDINTGRCLHTFQEVGPVSLSADGRSLLLESADHTLRLWEVPRHEVFCRLHLCKVQAYAKLSQQETQAEVWLGQARQAMKEGHFALAFDFLQRVRALPGWERAPKSLEAWSALGIFCSRVGLRTGWQARTFQGHKGIVEAVSLSADGKYALSAGDIPGFEGFPGFKGKLRLWEVSTGRCLRTFQEHTAEVTAVCWSADGRYALSGSQDKMLRLWEVHTGRCLRIFQGHTSGVTSVSLSADGRYALSTGRNGALRLWEVSTGRCLHIFQGQDPAYRKGEVNSVLHGEMSLSADGRYALSASWGLQRTSQMEERLQFWEVSTGRCLRTFQPHTIEMKLASYRGDGRTAGTVSLSTDGRYALSASVDKTLRLWEVSTGRCLHTFQGHSHVVTSVSLSADGRYALSGGANGTLLLWEFDWELEVHDPVDWDEAARPFLEIFLAQHTPYAATLLAGSKPSEKEIQRALTRSGEATWTQEDFQELIRQLQYAGLGWLRPEGIRRKLEEIRPSPKKGGKRKGWFSGPPR